MRAAGFTGKNSEQILQQRVGDFHIFMTFLRSYKQREIERSEYGMDRAV
jgi:hypothetical protein